MTLSQSILETIIAQARDEAPNEACGYLAGLNGCGKLVLPMRNVDESPEHYSFDPSEQFSAVLSFNKLR